MSEILHSLLPKKEKTILKKKLKKFPEKCLKYPQKIKTFYALDKVEKGTTIASVTSSSVGFLGGITTIVGLALMPVTLGASLIVTFVGIGVAAAAGATGVSAMAAKLILSKKNHNKVKAMMEEIIIKIKEIEECLQGIICPSVKFKKTSSEDCNNGTPVPDASIAGCIIYKIPLRCLGSLLISMSATVVRGIRAAAAVSGVLAGLFVVVDAAFIVKGSIDLHKGARSELAAKIREDAKTLEEVFQQLKDTVKDLQSDCVL
uniref:Apolipoprotein L3-like n=1 Tax=Leptobrachium leishanense TaxID=445787 RepID=A0A8C5MDR2_9ANUR